MTTRQDIPDHERTFRIDTAASDMVTLWVDIPEVSGTVCIDISTGNLRLTVYPGEITDEPWFDATVDMDRPE